MAGARRASTNARGIPTGRATLAAFKRTARFQASAGVLQAPGCSVASGFRSNSDDLGLLQRFAERNE